MHAGHGDRGGIVRRGKHSALVRVPVPHQAVVPRPAVRAHGRSLSDDVAYKGFQAGAGGIGEMAHPHSPEAPGLLDLDGDHDHGFAGPAPTLAAMHDASHEGLIDLDRSRKPFALAAHHRHAVALEQRPGGSVAGTHGALHGRGRETVLGGREMPGGLEPGRQWSAGLVEDRAGRHGRLVATGRANQSPARLTPRRPKHATGRAAELRRPAQLLQVSGARGVAGEPLDELAVRTGKVHIDHQLALHHTPLALAGQQSAYRGRS